MASIKKNEKTKKWEFVFDYYVNGKRKQVRRRGFDSKREANDCLVELQNEVQQGDFVEPSQMTVSQFMDDWLESRKGKIEETTMYNNICYVRNHIKPAIGDYKLQEITPIICQRFVDNMSNNGYAFNTVDRVTTTIKMAFDQAVRFKIIKQNYMRMVEMPKRTKKKMTVWTVEEINQFLEHTKTKRYYCVYVIALLTGMRQGEILGLRWQDIDFKEKLIYVRQTLTHYGKDFKDGAKTDSGVRIISLPEKLIPVLKAEYKKVQELKKNKGKDFEDHDLVICAENGKRVFPSNLFKAFKKDVKNSGVPEITFHEMRHTHATMLIQKNINAKIISERLGHSKIGITLDTYSHVLPSMQQEVAQKIDEMVTID